MRTRILTLSLALVLVISLVATQAQAQAKPEGQVYKWRIQTMWPGTSYHQWPSIAAFADYCRRASGGRLDIQVFPDGQIIPTVELFEAVGKGLLELGHSLPAYESGKVLAATLGFGVPYTFENHNEMSNFYYKVGFINLLREQFAKYNVYFLGPTMSHHVTFMTKKPVRKADDFKGLKLRATGLIADTVTKAGASAVFLPGSEIYPSLEKGVIDGTHWGAEGAMYSLGYHEVTKYVISPHLMKAACLEVYVNMDKWNALPDDLKAILEMGLQIFSIQDGNINEYNDYVNRQKMVKEKGIEVTYFPPEEEAKMRQYAMEVLDQYSAKDPVFAKGATMLKDYLKLMGRIK